MSSIAEWSVFALVEETRDAAVAAGCRLKQLRVPFTLNEIRAQFDPNATQDGRLKLSPAGGVWLWGVEVLPKNA